MKVRNKLVRQIGIMSERGSSPEEKIIITVSPIRRAQDLFRPARYLNRRLRWPYFHITGLADGHATFTTTRSGWQSLQRALEENDNDPLSIISVDGNRARLRVASTATIEAELGSEEVMK